MAIMGINFKEVENFILETTRIQQELRTNEEYRDNVLNQGGQYDKIKSFLQNFTSFLKYPSKVKLNNFYRIRKIDANTPYSSREDLIYPKPNLVHKDRMNNTKFRVLYTSLHEFTAIAETRIDSSFIGKNFQLTRFSSDGDINIYRLGLFSELYFNSPRDSDYTKSQMKRFLGSENHDSTIKGYSSLECAIANILYNQDDGYHLLSSILADAIFSTNQDVDAIAYPSMQNRYGTNLAIKQKFADSLPISYSSMNRLDAVYGNGFFKYSTKMECQEFSNTDSFLFTNIEGCCSYR